MTGSPTRPGAHGNVPPFDVVRSAFPPGISVVEASAGTGKTFNIAMSVVRLLLERDAAGQPLVQGIGNILVVTFTVAATDELVTRIRDMLRLAHEVYSGQTVNNDDATVQRLRALADADRDFARARVAQAVREVDTLAVFTIHSFCKRVLEEFALESGTAFGASLVDDDGVLLATAMQDWWRRRFYDDAALAAYAVANRWTPDTFAEAYRTWRRFPDVRLAPSPQLSAARAAVDAALAEFGTVWDEAAFRTLVGNLQWNSKAPCGNPTSLDALVAEVEAALQGDLGAAEEVAAELGVEALMKGATNRGNEQKARRAAIAEWPVARAASALAGAMAQLQHALRADCLQQVKQAVDREKRRRNALGFDDLLEQLSRVLTDQGSDGLLARAIRRQFQAALIDEFQDTDQHQFRIFDTAFAGRPLFLIGDPKQAIYAFRGADVHAYLGAARKAVQPFTLSVNFRSSTPMVEAVNHLFTNRPNAFVDAAIRFHEAEAYRHKAPTLYALDGEHTLHWLFVPPAESKGAPAFTSVGDATVMLFAACVAHIRQQLEAQCPPQEIAVLVRTTREGIAMAKALREARIPAVVSGLGNVLHSAEMAELQLVLEAIANPRQHSRVRAALTTHLWGATHDDLAAYARPEGEERWQAVLGQLDALRTVWTTRGVLQMLRQLFALRQVLHRLMALVDGDRRLTNLRHVLELLHTAASAEELSMEGVLRWIAMVRQDEQREREVAELRLETDAHAVQVMTIHKSKGLQFDVVYCPTLWQAFPADDAAPVLVHEDDGVVLDVGSEAYPQRRLRADVERLAEECRLAYVALTRARFRTYVGWGPVDVRKKRSAYSALAFLLHDQAAIDDLPVEQQPAAVAEWFAADAARWEPVLQGFAARYPRHMVVERLQSALVVPAPATAPSPVTAAFAARVLPAVPPLATRFDTFRMASFTALTAGAHGGAAGGADPDAVRDVDDARSDAVVAPVSAAISIRDLPRADFRTFPAGRRAGTVLHALFETSRFDDSPDVLRERVALRLMRAQLATDEGDARIDATVQMIQAVFAAPLSPWPVTLREVPPSRARHEWQFLLPFADARRPVSRFRLAECFEQHGGPDGVRYAAQVRRLPVGRLHGFLTGFVDLVFQHQERWYVVDWKSNQLGADPVAYTHDHLRPVLEASHYTLQYHLYLVALHRYLILRVPGYDYGRHIGGAAYAFLRGFGPDSARDGHGWFTDLPSRSLIESLSALMDPTPELPSRTTVPMGLAPEAT